MDTNLSPRQTQILKCLIEEYINTAEAVGSEVLDRKYSLGVSPATIRNEMGTLTDKGLLKQLHTSAGRVPTPAALRFYVDHLMQEKKMSVTEEVAAKEKIWDARFDFDHLMRHTTLALADRTKNLSVAVTDAGDVYYAGTANILSTPEFYDIDVTRTVLTLLDQETRIRQLFFDRQYDPAEAVHIVFGQDLGWGDFFEPVGFAFTPFAAGGGRRGILGLIGPCRLNFPVVLPTLRYFSDLVSGMTSSW
ncbi:MAG: Heat-inducible transcription repressor hrcA [Candidatus Amesbacteria bacterium GW2011_GWA1_47_20]|uniref:Heat-inducible transcription repressor HrcA n=1 Tax=Candidatus Amesbacteria bacterium GW2011_GWA1_47_20 TaxID=1618354 RepID=A0A0G1SKL9_9BACT|nr:MAG: Heat-inducible transcription repressor hrcA [Microgenomates group bacterium GW2011_GWC1_46_20]KKU69982.1 MAG: Heat-inducible transcription repressor hrcA [Candidatus Amesbacteria bacterium GW2011_GWA1_47_20]